MRTTDIVALVLAYTMVFALCWLSSVFATPASDRPTAFCIFLNVFLMAGSVVVSAVVMYFIAQALEATETRGEQTMRMFSGEQGVLPTTLWLAAVGAMLVIANIVTAVKLARMSVSPCP